MSLTDMTYIWLLLSNPTQESPVDTFQSVSELTFSFSRRQPAQDEIPHRAEVGCGNPDWSQQIMPTKASFWKLKNIQRCMPTFLPLHCALSIPALWPEIDGTERNPWMGAKLTRPGQARCQSLHSCLQWLRRAACPPPSPLSHPIPPGQSLSTKECVLCGQRQLGPLLCGTLPALSRNHSPLPPSHPVGLSRNPRQGVAPVPPHPKPECWHPAERSSGTFVRVRECSKAPASVLSLHPGKCGHCPC